jgi:hypothetical protein
MQQLLAEVLARTISHTSLSPSYVRVNVPTRRSSLTSRWQMERPDRRQEQTQDLGRWAYATIQGKQGVYVTTITAYQVCKNTVAIAGAKTAYMQQRSMLRLDYNPDPNPRQQFIDHLDEFLTALRQDPEHGILLMLDVNENVK